MNVICGLLHFRLYAIIKMQSRIHLDYLKMSDERRCPMKITTCYTVTIKQQVVFSASKDDDKAIKEQHAVDGSLMKHTAEYCLGALKLCTDIFLKEWDHLSTLPTGQKPDVLSRKRGADILIHSTKNSNASYPEFDAAFSYMPAYTRRAIIADALGIVSSYKSNLSNWEKQNPAERGEEPKLGFPDRYELTFYDQERDLCDIEHGVIGLKLYDGKTWDWHYFQIGVSDAKYIARLRLDRKMLSPVVEKVKGRYRIRFSFEENRDLVSDQNPLSYVILAVDLGINAPASWSVMTADGTVHAKGVIHLPCDEDRLNRLINRKRMYQSEGKKAKCTYRMVTNANQQLSIDTCRQLMRIAVLYSVDCIVFEHLNKSGRIKGKAYRERIHMWRAVDIQKRVEVQAHRNGMRISRVCAWGTSKLAFDGSGKVSRGKNAGLNTYSQCRFQNGKVYNCDLSASQNIGARFFLRAYEKAFPKIELPATPQRTYATLTGLVKNMAA